MNWSRSGRHDTGKREALTNCPLYNAVLMGFLQYLWREAAEIGGGHKYLLMVQDLAQQIGAALEIEFAEDIIEQEDRLLTGDAAHIGEFSQLGGDRDCALLAPSPVPE